MKKSPLGICLSFLLLFLAVSWLDSCREAPETPVAKQLLTEEELGGYGHGIALQDMRFLWRLGEDSIDIKLTARTTGWVGVGFNPEPEQQMKGANLIIGYVRDGKAEAADHYGIKEDGHKDDEKIGGQTHISNLSGSEAKGTTTLEFTIPLNSGDAMDKPLNPEGDNTVLLACGKSDNIVLKHKTRAILRLNLSTGENTVLRMK